jgi:DNA-binding IclR family transcriptional regulator
MEDDVRVLHWLAEFERNNPGLAAKDTDLAEALGMTFTQLHTILSGLRAMGELEARDYYTLGLGYYVFGIKLTLAGRSRLAEAKT